MLPQILPEPSAVAVAFVVAARGSGAVLQAGVASKSCFLHHPASPLFAPFALAGEWLIQEPLDS